MTTYQLSELQAKAILDMTLRRLAALERKEILDELEPLARGPYTGSLGYLGFNGNMDLNIIIRSLVVKDKKAYLQVGAGIVADSVPGKEYDETLYKAEAVLKAVFGEQRIDAFFAGCRAQSPVS